MFEEMDLGAKLQKVSRMDSRALPAEEVVAMATITGARALHMEKLIGSLEPGKMAAWIAPPERGINNLAVDYEYVRLA